MDIAARVEEIVLDKLGVDGADTQEDLPLIERLKADSLSVVEVVPDEHTERIEAIRDPIEYIEAQKGY